jgi:hypothetical protein
MKLLRVSLWRRVLRVARLSRRAPACAGYTVTVPAPLPPRSARSATATSTASSHAGIAA